ncbi:MAG: FAD:protein FMN transferase [Duncaniella sp.]|nr:FAD:protein FMN transferase [Duncaniella sp.]
MTLRNFIISLAGAAALTAVMAGCDRQQFRTSEGGVWNTTYRIVYRADKTLDDSILAVMKQVEMSLSPFNDSSLISRINRGEPGVKPDSLIVTVFSTSADINRRSGGAFDPTVAPLINAWGFGYRNGTGDPSQHAIDSLLELVGIAECRLTPDSIAKKHPLTEFNFSAITKGLGVDCVAAMLRRNGVTDYLVEIGGEIALLGTNPHGAPWRVMIDAPDSTDIAGHSRLTVISPPAGGLATSGNYRNFHTLEGGRRTWHTISPVTGYPAPSHILSATVIAPSTMEADALATSCMAMPPDSAMAMIERYEGAEALLVLPDMNLMTSTGFPELQN